MVSVSLQMCIMMCADHGPAVSGAHNTIVTARAGKDLVSSLVSGTCPSYWLLECSQCLQCFTCVVQSSFSGCTCVQHAWHSDFILLQPRIAYDWPPLWWSYWWCRPLLQGCSWQGLISLWICRNHEEEGHSCSWYWSQVQNHIHLWSFELPF